MEETTYKLTTEEANSLRGWAHKVAEAQKALEVAQMEFAAIQRMVVSRCPSPVIQMDLDRGVLVVQPTLETIPE